MLKEKIFENLGRQVNVTAVMIQMAFHIEIRKLTDLSENQVTGMMIMLCDQTTERDQLMLEMSLLPGEIELFLAPLIQKNLVRQSGNTLVLTEQGNAFLAELWPVVEKTHQALLENFSKEEEKMLYDLLEKLQNSALKILKTK